MLGEAQHTLLGLMSISSLILRQQGGGVFIGTDIIVGRINEFNALKRINCVGLTLTKCIELSQSLVQG